MSFFAASIKQRNMNRKLLFVCTGNYYRSRFAEEYFNHLAAKHNLKWKASSKGLSENMPSLNNPGPISVHTLEALQERGIEGIEVNRYPRPMEKGDFTRFDKIVALSELEHRPMLEARYLAQSSMVEYFEVGDLPLESPKEAMNKIASQVEKMMKQLFAETKRKVSISV
jgi:protein-tyrosine phosphatase